ncbi:hypothetical protein [Spirosoma aerophilum]
MTFNIFIPNKKGHYEDYSKFLDNLLENHDVKIVRSFNEKLKTIFRLNQNVIFLNIDHKDIYWSLVRSFFTKKNFGVSVSVDSLVNNKASSTSHYKNFVNLAKTNLKYQLFKGLKSSNRLKLISIHKMTSYEDQLKEIISFLTYDFQYYDLPYLNISYSQPKELQNYNADLANARKKSVLVFNNTSKAKKNLTDLAAWIETSQKYQFFIVGDSSFLKGNQNDNVVVINRYVSNEEMMYFMKKLDIIYCFYNNDKPSGFMGRAMQLGKKVIVPTNSYLGSIPYINSIRVTSLCEMEKVEFSLTEDHNLNGAKLGQFDDSDLLRQFLLNTK